MTVMVTAALAAARALTVSGRTVTARVPVTRWLRVGQTAVSRVTVITNSNSVKPG